MPEILSLIHEDKLQSSDFTSELGVRGESLAVKHLESCGYRVVMTNFRVPVGRNSRGVSVTGEIDIIALDGETLVFIEVKTRRSEQFVPVIANVDNRKQRQIIRTAKVYRRLFNVWETGHRYDVVTVLMPKNAEAEIAHVKGFWTESKFKKKTWNDAAWHNGV